MISLREIAIDKLRRKDYYSIMKDNKRSTSNDNLPKLSEYDKLSAVPGVYGIHNLIDRKVYIGSTLDLRNRIRKHHEMLRAGRHQNRYMQNAWNKHGADAFRFKIHETAWLPGLDYQLRLVEQQLLEKFRSTDRRYGYNLSLSTTGQIGRHSEETRRLISEKKKGAALTEKQLAYFARMKGRPSPKRGIKLSALQIEKMKLVNLGKKQSAETIAKRVWAMTGKKRPQQTIKYAGSGNPFFGKHHTAQSIEKNRIAHFGNKPSKRTIESVIRACSKQWLVIKPDGVEVLVINLTQFCKDNSLSFDQMAAIGNGRRMQHRGWKCRKID